MEISRISHRSWNQKAGRSLDQLRLRFPGHIHLPSNRFLSWKTFSSHLPRLPASLIQRRSHTDTPCRGKAAWRRSVLYPWRRQSDGKSWLVARRLSSDCRQHRGSSVCMSVNRSCVKAQDVNPFTACQCRTWDVAANHSCTCIILG